MTVKFSYSTAIDSSHLPFCNDAMTSLYSAARSSAHAAGDDRRTSGGDGGSGASRDRYADESGSVYTKRCGVSAILKQDIPDLRCFVY